jgi:AcrR family transcriptional regulator
MMFISHERRSRHARRCRTEVRPFLLTADHLNLKGMAMSEHPITPADHAAQGIVDLINSSPHSPTKEQIAAIISRIDTSPTATFGQSEHWREWLALVGAVDVASAKVSALIMDSPEATEAIQAAEAEASAAAGSLDDCARRIWQKPVRHWDDVSLLAAVCYWIFWYETDLTAPLDPDLVAAHENGICDEALAALLSGIRRVTRRSSGVYKLRAMPSAT